MGQTYDTDIISWYGKNIIQDTNNRLVTDVQIDYWNKKSNPDHTHDERYYTETEINNLLNNKSNIDHTHDGRYYTETEIDNKLKNISSSIPTTMTWESITGKPSSYPPSSHNHDTVYSKLGHKHITSDITDLKGILDNKANESHTHIIANITNLQTILDGKALKIHTHEISDVTNLQASLNSKSNTDHNHDTVYSRLEHIHDNRYYTETEIDNLLKGLSGDIGAITWNTLVGKPSTFPPSSHTHTTASITGLKTALATKSNTDHNHDTVYSKLGHTHDDRYYTETEMDSKIKTINDNIAYINWQTLTGKPSTFPPSSHTHSISNITNLQATLNKKSDSSHNHDSVYSKLTHTHDDRYYTETEIDAKLRDLSSSVTSISWDNLTGKPSTFPPSSHTHSYLPLSGGTITGQIKGSFGGSWNAAREQALVYNYNSTSTTYNPIIAGKSGSGVWSVGTYPYAGEDLFFAYNLDSDYNAGNNGSQIIKLPPRTGTIALTSDIPTWDSIKPYTAFFGGISLDTNGAYIYGESNSGNIFFRYKSSPGATDYSWGNIKDIASAAYGNHRHNQSTLDFTAETHFTLNGTYTDPLYGTGTAIKATGGIATDTSYATSFRTNYVDSTSLGGQCDLENILFTGGTQWGIGKTPNALMFGQYAGKGSSGVVKFRIQDRYCYIDNGLVSMGIVNTTTTNGANMRCAPNNGVVSIHSSASKYKLNIQNIAKPESYSYSILKVNPKQWYDKAETERYAKYLTAQYTNNNAIDDELKDIYSKSQVEPCYGLIAEDLEKAGLSEFCEYKEDKEGNKTVEGIQYERVPILLIPIIRDIISCMNKILPYVKEGKKIEDPNTLKQVEDLEKKFNYFKDEDVVNIKYDPQTSKIIE